MELVTKYILKNSNGKKRPICGSQIAKDFGISGIEVRRLISAARCKGDPICSGSLGYYIAADRYEIQKTIDSLEGRIAAMNNAKDGLQRYLNDNPILCEAVQ